MGLITSFIGNIGNGGLLGGLLGGSSSSGGGLASSGLGGVLGGGSSSSSGGLATRVFTSPAFWMGATIVVLVVIK